MCIVGVGKNSQKGAGDVERRGKAIMGCFLASLGNLLLPGANDETSFNTTACFAIIIIIIINISWLV